VELRDRRPDRRRGLAASGWPESYRSRGCCRRPSKCFECTEDLAEQLAQITSAPAGSLRQVHRQAAAYRAWEESPEHLHARQVADAWCAAFVWKKNADFDYPITEQVFRQDTFSFWEPLDARFLAITANWARKAGAVYVSAFWS